MIVKLDPEPEQETRMSKFWHAISPFTVTSVWLMFYVPEMLWQLFHGGH